MVGWVLDQKGGHLHGVKVLFACYLWALCADTHGNNTNKEITVSYL